MTDLDRVELRRLVEVAHSCVVIPRDTLMLSTSTLLALLDALDEAERERDEAWRVASAQTGLERSRAEAAEATLERVRAAVEAEKHYTEECGWDVPVIRLLAALAPATEEGDKENGDHE